MRMLMKVEIPTETGNEAFKNGSFIKAVQEVLGKVQPEAAYFTTVDGRRGGYVIFDLRDVRKIPSISEPLFLALGANVEFTPCFTAQELEQAGPDIQKAVQTYGS
ncbi:MAG: hypothetical protein ACRDFS_00745 [Chloroflexota bacterium]